MDMSTPGRCDFLQPRGGNRAGFGSILTAERAKELPLGGAINCGLSLSGNPTGEVVAVDMFIESPWPVREWRIGQPYLETVMRAMPPWP